MPRKAFTLIELLVVIAIIAILAAILFPVFAQAKESAKKSQNLSNTKQTATAMVLYSADSDDLFPLAYGYNADGLIDVDRYNGFPAGWDSAEYETGDATVWGNSIQPYMRNMQMFSIPSGPETRLLDEFGAAAYANPRKPPMPAAMTINGLISEYPTSAIARSSELVILWYGMGKENTLGNVNMNPALNCGIAPGPCRFNPGGMPSSTSYTGSTTVGDVQFSPYTDANDSVWMFGNGQNMAHSDSSAKFYRLGGNPGQNLSNPKDPFRRYGRKGEYWSLINRCTTGGGVRYMSFFRPDAEYRHQFGNTATTLCNP